MATKSKITIKTVEQDWLLCKGDKCISVHYRFGKYSILTRGGNPNFMFIEYKNKESLDNAKIIPQLIQEAVKFIEKQYENDKSMQKPSTKSR